MDLNGHQPEDNTMTQARVLWSKIGQEDAWMFIERLLAQVPSTFSYELARRIARDAEWHPADYGHPQILSQAS